MKFECEYAMERFEVDGDLIVVGDWKLHGAICKQLYAIVHDVLDTIPALEAARHGSNSGVQALCSLRIDVEKAKNLLQYCSECSKLYLAVTADCVLTKFQKARYALLESLHQVEETIPEAITSQIQEIACELEKAVFTLDHSEKQVGDEVNQLVQNEKKCNSGFLYNNELEIFRQAAAKVDIISSKAALTERRALKRLLERAHAEKDVRKESIATYLLHLMRKYSNIFRSETTDHNNSQFSSPSCSSTSVSSSIDLHGNDNAFERRPSKHNSFNLRVNRRLSGSMPLPPEELRCPISLQLMYDPVVIASGQTYERACIEKWFNHGNQTYPKTRKQLSQLSMTPNYCIKGLIASWCEHNGVPVPSAPPESPKLNRLRLASLKRSKSLATGSVDTILSEDTAVKGGAKVDKESDLEKCSHKNDDGAPSEKCEKLLRMLDKDECIDEQRKTVEQIRFLLKDDDELRNYVGANGFSDPLVQFLRMAVCRGDEQSQLVGAMALFNLAVSNNRNKKLLLSSGVIPLLEEMAQKTETCEAAVAMYLNLSCLGEAQPVIGSSEAVPLLIQSLQEVRSRSNTCRLDALLALYNLSLHAPNIPRLIASGIIQSLYTVLMPCSAWADKALTVLINLGLTRAGKQELVSNPALLATIVLILDNGEAIEKEKAVSCLWVICSGDEGGSYTVLQEGVIPALVSLTANGTTRAKDKAQRLLKLFRDQRQRELDRQQPQVQLHEVVSQAAVQQQPEEEDEEEEAYAKPAEPSDKRARLSRRKSKKFGRALKCLLKKWS